MATISAVIIAKDEEKRLRDCLESVVFADEIIVVDDSSEDRTKEVARKFTKHVYSHKSRGFVEVVRNFAISKATKEWILLLDADEKIPKELSVKLQEISDDKKVQYVKIPRKNIIFAKWIRHNTGWWPDYQVRFFRQGTLVWPEAIHAQPEPAGEGVQLEAEEKYALIHSNYETVSQFLEKLDRYTTQEAEEKGVNTAWEDSLLLPSDEFISRFFAREGYKDGMHGLVLSLLEAFYAQVAFAKRWEKGGFYGVDQATFLQRTHTIMQKIAGEVEYWYLTTKINETKNPLRKVRLSLKRKKLRKKIASTS